MNYAVNMCLAV